MRITYFAPILSLWPFFLVGRKEPSSLLSFEWKILIWIGHHSNYRAEICQENHFYQPQGWSTCRMGDGPSCVVDFRDPGVRTPECGWSRVRCFWVLWQGSALFESARPVSAPNIIVWTHQHGLGFWSGWKQQFSKAFSRLPVWCLPLPYAASQRSETGKINLPMEGIKWFSSFSSRLFSPMCPDFP